ncbi:hypothetical protein EVAR_23054_1 [Eumeta japonica]|uniref:Uncharacterized protein n=1 Tax=Eumeta variegata TaxID=151549 RepID=A0A4C1VNJ9_EUMVA|nr:hypothetical protein EVAR_23054_1 [Eumeta japonica]
MESKIKIVIENRIKMMFRIKAQENGSGSAVEGVAFKSESLCSILTTGELTNELFNPSQFKPLVIHRHRSRSSSLWRQAERARGRRDKAPNIYFECCHAAARKLPKGGNVCREILRYERVFSKCRIHTEAPKTRIPRGLPVNRAAHLLIRRRAGGARDRSCLVFFRLSQPGPDICRINYKRGLRIDRSEAVQFRAGAAGTAPAGRGGAGRRGRSRGDVSGSGSAYRRLMKARCSGYRSPQCVSLRRAAACGPSEITADVLTVS